MATQTGIDWHAMTDEVMTGMKDWQVAHPKATLKEIEIEIEIRLSKMRARMLEAAALKKVAEERGHHAICPNCQTSMVPRGEQVRRLVTQHNQEIEINREYEVCPKCNFGFFPPR